MVVQMRVLLMPPATFPVSRSKSADPVLSREFLASYPGGFSEATITDAIATFASSGATPSANGD